MVGQIRKLPPEVWPMIQSHWCDPGCFRAMARQLAALPECAAAVEQEMMIEETARNGAAFGDTPIIETPFILLSAGDASAGQRAAQERMVEHSARGRIEIVEDRGHWIQLDRPDVVVNAIHKMTVLKA